MNWNVFWGYNPQPHLVAADIQDLDKNIFANDNLLIFLTGQYQHFQIPLEKMGLRDL